MICENVISKPSPKIDISIFCKWQKPQRKIIVELSNERPDGQPRAKVGPLDYAYVDMSDAEVEKSARSDLWILDDVQFARRTARLDIQITVYGNVRIILFLGSVI